MRLLDSADLSFRKKLDNSHHLQVFFRTTRMTRIMRHQTRLLISSLSTNSVPWGNNSRRRSLLLRRIMRHASTSIRLRQERTYSCTHSVYRYCKKMSTLDYKSKLTLPRKPHNKIYPSFHQLSLVKLSKWQQVVYPQRDTPAKSNS